MKRCTVLMRILAALLIIALLIFAKQFYPRPANILEAWLFGEEINPVTQAFAALSDSMEQGEGLGQAVQAFCGEADENAGS